MREKTGRRLSRTLVGIAIALVALFGACAIYVGDYYHADEAALAALSDDVPAADGVEVLELAGGACAFVPERPAAGLVFYPGAKVQPEAYAPLMRKCAQGGILCVLLRPRFNLAIFDADAADGIAGQFPEVDRWLAAGHSMGGVVAADYVGRHSGDFEGVVFLASYPSADLSDFGGGVLSVVGSEDAVLNRESYERARDKLPSAVRELVIEGGNHANFGNYGNQAGDGAATISREQQQAQTAEAVAALCRRLP